MNTKQKLGIRVLYFYLSRRITIGLLLLFAFIILSSTQSFIASTISPLLGMKTSLALIHYLSFGLFLISILLILVGIFMSWLDYIGCTFSLEEQSIKINRGILNKKEVSIPYRQVQDITIEQTFYNRMMGVSRLVILTAGDDNNDKEGESEGIFEVVDSKLAEKMRSDILSKNTK